MAKKPKKIDLPDVFMEIRKFMPDLDLQSKITLNIVLNIAIAVIIWLSILGLASDFGRVVSSILYMLVGYVAILIPFISIYIAAVLIKIQKNLELAGELNLRMAWGIFLMCFAFTGALSIVLDVQTLNHVQEAGGITGYILYPFLLGGFGGVGAFIIILFLFFIGFFLFSQLTFVDFTTKLKKTITEPNTLWELIPDVFEIWKSKPAAQNPDSPYFIKKIQNLNQAMEIKNKFKNHKTTNLPDPKLNKIHKVPLTSKRELQWQLPGFELLSQTKNRTEAGDIEGNKNLIKDTLDHFGIEVEMVDTVTGPTVTQYRFKPAQGIKLSSIDSVQRDLALALAVNSLRIESPVGGQSLVGIEIPNKVKSIVSLRSILQSKEFVNFEKDLPVSIGQDVSGQNIVWSLAKMPHLLVAGATGSGKSIWVNSMLISLLYRYSPEDLHLILVDMKRVELKLYENIPHLLTPVITDAESSINALKWVVLEMDRRYKLLEEFGKRNISDFNEFANISTKDEIEKMPYLVLVIDELQDLMMLAKSEVEPIIARLTQMSRAVGIHLVLGTQRPDTNVVTGLIKANIPSRIAFAVASQIDSRVILDNAGAEKLLGHGDGLFLNTTSPRPVRFQGALISEEEINKCIRFLRQQAINLELKTQKDLTIVEPPKANLHVPGLSNKSSTNSDEVYQRAKEAIARYQKASTSFLQQTLGVGYPKAAKLMQYLEDEGLVGPPKGSKPRDVYITSDDLGLIHNDSNE